MQKSSAFYQQHTRTSVGRSSGIFLTSRGTFGIGGSRRVGKSSSLAADQNAPAAALPQRLIICIAIAFPIAIAIGLAAESLVLTLLLVLMAFGFMIYLGAPTDEELQQERRWRAQWYCRKCGTVFFEENVSVSAQRSDGTTAIANVGFVSPVIRSTRRNSRADYEDRVRDPVQRASAMTDRDLAGLGAIKSHAAADGTFHPEVIGCDLGVISRLASLDLIKYDAKRDRFYLRDEIPPPPSSHRGWWQRTFG